MNKNLKIIRKLIIFFILLIVFILTILLGRKRIENKSEIETNNSFINEIQEEQDPGLDEPPEIKIEKSFNYITDSSLYYAIDKIIGGYISSASIGDTDYLINMLSPTYISNKKITTSNIINKIGIPSLDNINQYYTYDILSAIEAEKDERIRICIVEVKYREIGENGGNRTKVMIVLDMNNKTFDLYPEEYVKEKGIDKVSVGNEVNINIEAIENRKTNNFNIQIKTDNEMANNYFNSFKNRIEYDKDLAYTTLNNEYANKRFGNKTAFENYLNENKYLIATMKINTYIVKQYADYTDYVCTDQYENYYIFRQQGGIMRYTVFLDTYTIPIEMFEKEYHTDNEQKKVNLNLNRFNQMINTKDYNAIYDKLNQAFKTNNFKTVNELKTYINNNFYRINNIELTDVQENGDYYVIKANLIDQTKPNTSKAITIAMKLGETTNFEISFSID